VRKGLEI
jgi:Ca2+ transporting ATPase